jgi:hypothetical protein
MKACVHIYVHMRIVRASSIQIQNTQIEESWLTVSILVEKMESLSEFCDLGLSELRHRPRIRESLNKKKQKEAASSWSSSPFFFLFPSSGVPHRVHTCPDKK